MSEYIDLKNYFIKCEKGTLQGRLWQQFNLLYPGMFYNDWAFFRAMENTFSWTGIPYNGQDSQPAKAYRVRLKTHIELKNEMAANDGSVNEKK